MDQQSEWSETWHLAQDELSSVSNTGIETTEKHSSVFRGGFACLVACLMNSLITSDRIHFVESLWCRWNYKGLDSLLPGTDIYINFALP